MKEKNKKSLFHSKHTIMVMCLLLLMIIALCVAILRWKPKPDPASEEIIRAAAAGKYGKDPNELTDQDYALFEKVLISHGSVPFILDRISLSIYARELSDIKILEKFTNLQELSLQSIKYPDKKIPKMMEILAKYGVIDLEKRFTIDLCPIQNLTALKTLRLSSSQISDISPLKDLVNLEQLFIDSTLVSDLKSLRGLKNLQVLSINSTNISDLEPIMHLEKLQNLLVRNCPNIKDQQLKELRTAHPDIVIIKDYLEEKSTPTSKRIILEAAAGQLGKDPNELTDKDFAKIIEFSIHAASINNYGEFMYIPPWGVTELPDIRLLEKFINLELLDLFSIRYPENNIPEWMKYLARHGVFDLDKKFAIDLRPIQNLHALVKLRLSNSQIYDIKPLKKLTNLEELYIEHCPNVTDDQVKDVQKALPNCKIIR